MRQITIRNEYKALLLCFFFLNATQALAADSDKLIATYTKELSKKVVAWRRDIHQHPELGNRETRTAKLVSEHLRSLGMEVQTEVAHTGVVGLLKGGKAGPVVALRADMDALPVTERVDIPFASKVRTSYNGKEVGVMHACGHDVHTAVLMGVAEVLHAMRDELQGSVKFIFQPAEEGPPAGEEGGAKLMIKEGVLAKPRPEVIFGLHTFPAPPGVIGYRKGGTLAAADSFKITVTGAQTHGARPWAGNDPIVVASQIVMGLQMIPSRQLDSTLVPTIISIGSIHGGLRSNIIPDTVEMEGTIRTLDTTVREDVLQRIHTTATNIAASAGAKAQVNILPYAPVTYNDPELTERMLPSLRRVAGKGLTEVRPLTPSEDFSFYQEKIPGLYFFLGVNKEGVGPEEAASNHSPLFYVNEDVLPLGVKALSTLVVDYLKQ
ncbi:MAG: amidohydrolase [Gammaproteobacteria bacterium]|nr:amidohydrolase [Gammaproteobacteria bacterium]